MNVPFLELKPTYAELREEMDAAYHRVMDSGWYLLGTELEAFEEEFARYCGARKCVAVGNGLDALHLATMVFLRANNQSIELATYDSRLASAAAVLGFPLADV